jgi:hypothetical protein
MLISVVGGILAGVIARVVEYCGGLRKCSRGDTRTGTARGRATGKPHLPANEALGSSESGAFSFSHRRVLAATPIFQPVAVAARQTTAVTRA